MPLMVQAQSEKALEHRAEISNAIKFDKTTKPLREMFDTGERPEPARGGRDFEPGRPQPVGNRITPFTDPLADKSVGLPSALAEIKASTNGVPIDPQARVAPPDTTGDVGPNHYVQWVNLRYSIYTLVRGVNNEITAFVPVAGFPKNGGVVWQGFGGRCGSDNDGDPIVQYDQLADRWVLTQFAVSGTTIHSVRGRFDESGSHWNVFPLCVLVRQKLQRLSEDGRLAGCLLHQLQHVSKWPFVHRQHCVCFRARSNVGRRSGAASLRQHNGGPQPRTGGSRRHDTAAGRLTKPVDEYDHFGAPVLAIRSELDRRNRHIDWSNHCFGSGCI